jgi:hypothetical protein
MTSGAPVKDSCFDVQDIKTLKLHNEELYYIYASPNIITAIKSRGDMGRACILHRERRSTYRLLIGKHKGQTPPARPKCR